MSAALKCAAHVYKLDDSEPSLDGYSIKAVGRIGPSRSGVVKATQFSEVKSTTQSHEKHFPALIIAICGTRPSFVVDWLVNFNQELRDIAELVACGLARAAYTL